MSDEDDAAGPWGARKGPPPQAPTRRLPTWRRSPGSNRDGSWGLRTGWVWIAALAAVVLGVAALMAAFPGRIASLTDWSGVAWGVGMIVVVGSSLAARRLRLRQTLRYVLIWAAILSVLVVAVIYWPEIAEFGQRLRSRLVPAYAVQTGPQEFALNRDQDGQYYAVAQVNGRPVTFMVDTGSSDIVLSPADARRLGVDTATLRYSGEYETANGVGHGAQFKADSFALGPIRLSQVGMSINQAPMRTSLLGMSFFKRLQGMRFEGDRLLLRIKAAR